MQSMKETASNVAASAKAGMEKTRATLQEKAEKMSAHDPVQKEMAMEKKEERKAQAELEKQEAKRENAAARNAASATGGQGHYTSGGTERYVTTGHETRTHSASGVLGHPTGTQQMSAVPGHGTGGPYVGQVDDDGVVRTHPSGLPGETMGRDTRMGGTGTGADAAGYGRRV